MKMLVTGVHGQLGHDVLEHLAARGVPAVGADIGDFDLTDEAQALRWIAACSPDVVIHCAAWTAVDKAESNEAQCRQVNADGTRHVALACGRLDAAMLYVSTDYVFGGAGAEPFETDALIAPLNVYGRTKAEGEAAVRELLKKHFIVRTSWVFGVNGGNFAKTMLHLGKEKESLGVVRDQVGSPTYSYDLARLLCDMAVTERYGVYHATNEGYCSFSEFAAEIMRQAGLPCRIEPIPSSAYPTPAKRPLNARLSKRSLDEAGFSRLPHWKDALARYLEALKPEQGSVS